MPATVQIHRTKHNQRVCCCFICGEPIEDENAKAYELFGPYTRLSQIKQIGDIAIHDHCYEQRKGAIYASNSVIVTMEGAYET